MKHAVIMTLLLVTLLSGCDEQLPSYQEPKDVLAAFLQKTTGDTVTVVIDSLERFLGSEPTRLRVYVQNRHIQLLEGAQLINGKINLFSFVPLPRAASLSLGRSNLFSPPIFQQHVALPPGDSAKLEIGWSHTVIGGGRLYDSLQYTERYQGTTRIRTFAPISITAEGEIQIFERVQAVPLKPITFTLVIQELRLGAQ
ncbi:MAG: hypothetical protein KF749_09045 [Bacteroidetes bacterium]|nr:hypothetical protein [Bacteroidota bacterium]MCW5894770.1 hypothetical protein [Bacteroidota bacterium]